MFYSCTNCLIKVDIAAGWTEERAVWGKSNILIKIKKIEKSLPSDLRKKIEDKLKKTFNACYKKSPCSNEPSVIFTYDSRGHGGPKWTRTTDLTLIRRAL
ncbi:MAG: hypothetical protein H6Q95_173 [Nitrospirae bacterium]|nr:hypothetical protein [Nitrospirota bacterium]